MSSHLRRQSSFAPFSAHNTAASFPHHQSQLPAQRKQKKMTVTQTYRLAHTARGKLSSEASRGDHDLRLLVGHANLLDSLMLDLQEAEREQEAWFNATVRGASQQSEKPQHIQWKDTVIAERELDIPDGSDTESDSDSEYDASDDTEVTIPLRKIRSPPALVRIAEEDDDEDMFSDEDDEDFYDEDVHNASLTLTRTQSRSSSSSPPELVSDSDESDDDMSPSSPPTESVEFSIAKNQHLLQTPPPSQKMENYSPQQCVIAAC